MHLGKKFLAAIFSVIVYYEGGNDHYLPVSKIRNVDLAKQECYVVMLVEWRYLLSCSRSSGHLVFYVFSVMTNVCFNYVGKSQFVTTGC